MSDQTGWDPAKAQPLAQSSKEDTWTTEIDLPSGTKLEYKLVTLADSGEVTAWQEGDNRVVEVPEKPAVLRVRASWEGQPEVSTDQEALSGGKFTRAHPVEEESHPID